MPDLGPVGEVPDEAGVTGLDDFADEDLFIGSCAEEAAAATSAARPSNAGGSPAVDAMSSSRRPTMSAAGGSDRR
jgi:hypothetical protein